MNLLDLYPRTTKLADVPPLFRGMRLKEWQRLQIQAQCEAYKGVPDGAAGTEWRGKSTSHRNNYGWRSI